MILHNCLLFIILISTITSSSVSDTASVCIVPDVGELKKDCNHQEMLCMKPEVDSVTKDKKCAYGYHLQMRENEEDPFENIEGGPTCRENIPYGMRKGGFKILDIGAVRCAKEICKVNPSMGNGKCFSPCKNAIHTSEKIVCESGSGDLEVQQIGVTTNAWAHAEEIDCSGQRMNVKLKSAELPETNLLNIRCRIRPEPVACEVTPYFNETLCEATSICTTPIISTNKMSCQSGTLQAILDDWKDISDFVVQCNTDKRMVMMKDSIAYEPQMLRCNKERGCDLANYEELSCDDEKNECKKPEIVQNTLKCDEEFELQAKIENWNKASISCVSNSFLDESGSVIVSARCVRMNIIQFFDSSLCDTTEECKEPTGHSSVTCDNNFYLQTRNAGRWTEVKIVKGDSDKFTMKNMNDEEIGTQPEKIRCVRMRCSICTDPCPSCTPSIFTPSTKPNECSSFGCGPNSRTLIATETATEEPIECHQESKEGETFWKKADGSKIKGDVKCEKLCTLQFPLKSLCEGIDRCEIISFNDDAPIKCDAHLIRKSNNDKTLGTELICDKTKGEWKMKTIGGEVKVEANENVYCELDECSTDFCPECEQNKPGEYRCPEGKTAKVDTTDSSHNFAFFTCTRGKWFDAGGTQMQDTDKVKCNDGDKEGSGRTSDANSILLAYISILIFVILLIAILLAFIVCRLQGKGWLHTIIIGKIRGGKKKGGKGMTYKKEMKSGKRTHKADSSAKGASKNTDKDTSNVEPGAPSSAELVKMSGEKVSAEGLSVTGASAEKFSSENVGAAIPSGSNEAVDPMNPQGTANVVYA